MDKRAASGNDRACATTQERIDALLPQTQCRRCGFEACRPYAAAVAEGRAAINQCPPGGARTIAALAELLGREPMPLDAALEPWDYGVALVDEPWCIGCTACIKACPVDAIVGAAGLMHTVVAEDCTGCGLCVAPCPTDCIRMVPVAEHPQHAQLPPAWQAQQAERARRHFEARQSRLRAATRDRSPEQRRGRLRTLNRARKRAVIEDAIRRVRERRLKARDPTEEPPF